MDAISTDDLRKTYGARPVLRGLHLRIPAGECFALLGPNGAGKTTAVEILAGARPRTSGQVRVLGVDPAVGNRSWRARIGVVGQATGATLELTVAEVMRHFAHYHARPRDTGELLDALDLRRRADTRIGRLSGGERRRLDVAIGVQGRPRLLFLDEPTTGLDPQARRQFWTLLDALRSDGTTILITTHYLDEAAHLADRVGVLVGGRLLDVAPPARLGAHLQLPTVVRWTGRAGPVTRTTNTPTRLLRDLLREHPGGELADLSVRPPTLEDAYLALLAARSGADPEPVPDPTAGAR